MGWGDSPEEQKPNVESEIYNKNKKCDLEKKKLKVLIRYHSVNKIDKYNRGGKKKKKRKKKRSKRIYRTTQNIRRINIFLESLLSESFPAGSQGLLTSLGCPPTPCWSLDLLWGQLRF